MRIKNFILPGLALVCLLPVIPSGAALLLGIVRSLLGYNPYKNWTQPLAKWLLQIAVVGLGAGMNLMVLLEVGAHGVVYTFIGISLTLLLGLTIGRFLKAESETALLITVGTAICGGSAIAAVASTMKAKPQAISVSLVTVFFLNAIALWIFPFLGHLFQLTETQFGLWSALAIHDTSSVVGASMQYGKKALEIATTVKLARALWIIPLCLVLGFFWKTTASVNSKKKIGVPWFIIGFVLMAAFVTAFPALQAGADWVLWGARRLLVVTLFLIGSNLSLDALKSVGIRPFLQGFILWILAAMLSLLAIFYGWVRI